MADLQYTIAYSFDVPPDEHHPDRAALHCERYLHALESHDTGRRLLGVFSASPFLAFPMPFDLAKRLCSILSNSEKVHTLVVVPVPWQHKEVSGDG